MHIVSTVHLSVWSGSLTFSAVLLPRCPFAHSSHLPSILFSLILAISVFLTTLPCLDSHRWGWLRHITDRWITRGNTCSTAGLCRFPCSHMYTNRHPCMQRFWHYIAPDSVYMRCNRWMKSLQAPLPTNQCSTCEMSYCDVSIVCQECL